MQEWKCPKCEHVNNDVKCKCGYKLPFDTRMFLSMSPVEGFIIGTGFGAMVGGLLYALVVYIKA